MLDQAARTIADLRGEGHRVLTHCAGGHSRTPTVAARYGMLKGASATRARQEIEQALGFAPWNQVLWGALDCFEG